ncbi:MAG: cell wall hydrolase [Ruminococcus sp.]|jgi:spore germination cell wall hydrolase CwlJ-like protein|nr:cell wall hydrolase [Ruminococcus sp.]
MRKAKVAAIIVGGVSTCIFGGLFGVYATAPIVSQVAPSHDVENIYEVKSEELANVAAVTSIRTTTATTSRKFNTTTKANAAKKNVNIGSATASAASFFKKNEEETPAPAPAPAPAEPITEAETETVEVTEPETEAPTTEAVYVEPATEAPTEAAEEEEETEPVTEAVTEAPTEAEVEVEVVVDETPSLPITDAEYIILCNAVAHEAGCSWISEYDKAKVVEVIMNRVNSPRFPNSIEAVLTQPYQFSGSSSYVYLGTYSCYVTESVKNAVDLYFNEPESFTQGYLSFYGDGYRNYFS